MAGMRLPTTRGDLGVEAPGLASSLPCWDETDNGIPDVCLEYTACPFNPDNKCTNDNFVCHVFGNIGFPYFDRTRKVFMGIAMWSTLSAMFITAFGALSLSTNPDVVRASYWALLEATNSTDGEVTTYYLGLRSIVTVYEGGEVSRDTLEIDYMVGKVPGSKQTDPIRDVKAPRPGGCVSATPPPIMKGAQSGPLMTIAGILAKRASSRATSSRLHQPRPSHAP